MTDHLMKYADPLAQAEIDRLRAKIARVEAMHQPMTDGPFSIIDWTYCSCGAKAVRKMSDGYPSLVPVEYDKCPVRAALADPEDVS